ncbi:hypothetical protein [Microbacterium paludicola]|uniref:hypothetical protein n=1 Tax=Microbacterium paludicola TaxID=300019 RepID=UPI0031DF4CED
MRAGLEVWVDDLQLAVQGREQLTRLPIRLGIRHGGAILHERAGQVLRHEQLRLEVGVQQSGRASAIDERCRPFAMGADLPGDVVVARPASLHDDHTVAVRHPQDRRLQHTP